MPKKPLIPLRILPHQPLIFPSSQLAAPDIPFQSPSTILRPTEMTFPGMDWSVVTMVFFTLFIPSLARATMLEAQETKADRAEDKREAIFPGICPKKFPMVDSTLLPTSLALAIILDTHPATVLSALERKEPIRPGNCPKKLPIEDRKFPPTSAALAIIFETHSETVEITLEKKELIFPGSCEIHSTAVWMALGRVSLKNPTSAPIT